VYSRIGENEMAIDKRQVYELESALMEIGWARDWEESLFEFVWSYEGSEKTDLINAAAMTIRGLDKVKPPIERRGLISRLIGRGDAVGEGNDPVTKQQKQ
jgi:hypothetical protein